MDSNKSEGIKSVAAIKTCGTATATTDTTTATVTDHGVTAPGTPTYYTITNGIATLTIANTPSWDGTPVSYTGTATGGTATITSATGWELRGLLCKQLYVYYCV